MKIRIRRNSVRLRLTRSEVETFCATGEYLETTEFNENIFSYGLRSKDSMDSLSADFRSNAIIIYVPSKERKVWASTDKVGFHHNFQLDNGQELSLLVEKDFVCLDESVEDQSDNYPNPKSDKLDANM